MYEGTGPQSILLYASGVAFILKLARKLAPSNLLGGETKNSELAQYGLFAVHTRTLVLNSFVALLNNRSIRSCGAVLL